MKDHLTYERLGGTLDDAAGEAFDKVARLIGLEYPGGPAIQKASVEGNPQAFAFPRAWLEGSWNFSFSGLKTAVMREVRRLQERGMRAAGRRPGRQLPGRGGRRAGGKTMRAAETLDAAEILVAGGVSANQALREAIQDQAFCPVHIPPLSLCTDTRPWPRPGTTASSTGSATGWTWTCCPTGRCRKCKH